MALMKMYAPKYVVTMHAFPARPSAAKLLSLLFLVHSW